MILVSKLSFLLQTICFLFITTSSYSQKAIITEIKDTNPISKEKYVFPFVTIPGNKSSTKNINKLLQDEALQIDSSGYKKSIFENIWERENLTGGFDGWTYTDFEYKVLSNTDHYVSLSISFIGGRHPYLSTIYFLFDNRNGENIKFNKILTPEGQKWLVNTLVRSQKLRIENYLPSLDDSLKLPRNSLNPNDSTNREYFQEQFELYKRCLEETMSLFEAFGIEDLLLYVKEGKLRIDKFGCGRSWNDIRLDELGDYKFSIPITEIPQYLTPYGKKLLMSHSK